VVGRRHNQRGWSLCGITHTTASDTVMEAIGTFATAPLQSWDAVAALFLGRLSATAKAHPLPMFRGLQAAHERTKRKVHLILAG
jgi:hypothetical protein